MRGTLAVLLALGAFVAQPATAQVQGDVRGPDGVGLEGATIEAWGPTGLLARRFSDAAGRFAIPVIASSSMERLTVQLLGYRTVALTSDSWSSGTVAVQLVVEPISLPELLAVASAAACPAPDEPGARAVWEAAAQRYSDSTAQRSGAARVSTRQDEIPESLVGSYDGHDLQTDETTWEAAYWPAEAGRRPDINAQVLAQGYTERRDGGWLYPHLGGTNAFHFASYSFGELHTFSLEARSPAQTTLRFCPRSDHPGTISGTLSVGEAGRLLDARWIFESGDSTREAGGQVLFAEFETEESKELHLVAARGAFWRHLPGRSRGGERSYYQLTEVFETWFINPTSGNP